MQKGSRKTLRPWNAAWTKSRGSTSELSIEELKFLPYRSAVCLASNSTNLHYADYLVELGVRLRMENLRTGRRIGGPNIEHRESIRDWLPEIDFGVLSHGFAPHENGPK